MLDFFMTYGWGILLTINAIVSAFWAVWVTHNLKMLLRERRLYAWKHDTEIH